MTQHIIGRKIVCNVIDKYVEISLPVEMIHTADGRINDVRFGLINCPGMDECSYGNSNNCEIIRDMKEKARNRLLHS